MPSLDCITPNVPHTTPYTQVCKMCESLCEHRFLFPSHQAPSMARKADTWDTIGTETGSLVRAIKLSGCKMAYPTLLHLLPPRRLILPVTVNLAVSKSALASRFSPHMDPTLIIQCGVSYFLILWSGVIEANFSVIFALLGQGDHN